MTNSNAGYAPGTNSIANAGADPRIRIAALWAAMMFIFAYVDIFALFRADIIDGINAGTVAGLQIDQVFLFATTAYVIVPSVMVYGALVVPQRLNRWLNIVLAVLYAVSILASCIGETWMYYLLGSAVEVVLLVILAVTAWRWRTA